MKWFEGQIATAISQAKQQKSLFVVYITGSNDDSEKMDKTWQEEEVSKICIDEGLVVMRFQANSEECKQFSVYYPVICVPCVYFISGETGVCVESVAGFLSAADFMEKLHGVIQTSKQAQASSPPVQQPSTQTTSPQPVAATPEASAQVNAAPPSEASSSGTAPSSSKESLQERAARMRQKMEEVHRKKEQQRKETEKQKEIERRRVGQEVQKADRQRSELQAKLLAEERRKERAQERLAKEKVMEQIARDKAEKDARFRAQKEEREAARLKAETAKNEAARAEQAQKDAAKLDTATIQFRLPDGSTRTQQFASSAPLQEARDFIVESAGDILKEFTMSITFPRRNFGPDDMQTSLRDLQLAPRSAIVILPGKLRPTSSSSRSSSQQQVSTPSSGGLISLLLAPIIFIYNLIYNFLFGRPETSPPSSYSSSSSTSQSSDADDSTSSRFTPNRGARPKSSYARRRTPASGDSSGIARREGNIHRLNTQQDDEDDENNTWNGNSTQQM